MKEKLPILKKPDAILFDTDDTLYEYGPANEKAMFSASLKAEKLLGISKVDFRKYFNLARNEIKLQLGNTASSHSRLLYFQRMLEILDCKAQLMIALDLEQTFWRTFLANAPLFDGVIELLDDLRFNSIPIGIVTDLTAHIQLRKLTYFHLEDTFDAVVCSEEVGADKPDSKNFQLALKKLRIKDASNVWVVGDNAQTDILGGKNVGAITFQKVHKGVIIGKGAVEADIIFNEFYELKKLFDKTKIN